MIKIFFYITSSFLLLGCGSSGGGSNSGGSSISGSEESGDMTLNKLYIMHPGNRVEKHSYDATIEVLHANNNPDSSIKLILGKASIVR